MDEKKREELLKKIEEYSKKIEKNPNDASNYYNRGNAYYNRGDTFKSLEKFQEAVDDFKKAIEDYNKAIELNPNNASYYNNRGNAYGNLKKYEKATEDYDKAIELNPNSASYYYNRGLNFSNLQKYEKAIEDYDKAIELNPNNNSYHNSRGNALNNSGKYEEAIQDYDKAIALNSNYDYYYYNKALARYRYQKKNNDTKNFDEIIKNLNKALDLNSNNNSAKKLKKNILELKENKKFKESSQQDNNKIVDISKNIENLEEMSKEDYLEPNFISDFNEVKALYLNGIFKETKKNLNLFIKKYKKDSKKERQIENLLKEVESIREFLENHQKASNGYLTFADILGWKGIWKKQNSDNEKVDTLNTLLFIKNKLEEEFKEQRKDENNDDYKINLISDTYVIYSKELELSNKLSKRLLELCLINGLLIRGATSYGNFYNNDMVYIGQAVDEAASWHEKGEEVGIFYTSSARLSKNLSDNELEKYLLINDEVNTKIGKIKTYFINWYNDITERNFYSIMKNEVINPEYSLKYFNTENRLNEILHPKEKEKK